MQFNEAAHPYEYKLIRYQKYKLESPQKGLFSYHFRTRFGFRYIVDVELFDNQFYIVKYYYTGHRRCKKKFNIHTRYWFDGKHHYYNDGFRILSTCMSIMINIHKTNTNASFGFIGATSMEKKKIEGKRKKEWFCVEDIDKTKRFRIYRIKCFTLFSPENFDFLHDEKCSSFIIKNKKCTISNSEINNCFNDFYLDLSVNFTD